jgi:acyl-coenzyme A synthetase/AMP-(fatty) acid ligase
VRSLWPRLRSKNLRTCQILDAATSGKHLTDHVCELWATGVVPLLVPNDSHGAYDLSTLSPPEAAVIGFVTSGTSSTSPTVIWKSWNALNSEALTLMREFNVTTSSRILTMVPPVHIYGFLYSVLLPAVSGAALISSQRWDISLFGPCELAESADTIITVPPLWSVLERMLPFFAEGCDRPLILTSGAPFGLQRIAAAAKLRQECGLTFRIVDIVGSTETGGIGFSTVAGDVLDDSFKLFDGVNVFAPTNTGGLWTISSPFTDCAELAVSDVFLPGTHDRTFRYGGRSDRVVKLGARRFNLSDIESAISQCANGSTVACLFKQDPDSAKGGGLFVFIESPDLLPADVFAAYQREFKDLPLPTHIHISARLPKGALGKTSRAELEKLLLDARL